MTSSDEANSASRAPRDTIDARYVAARRVLLDALGALAPHGRAVIVAGAQAVYLRTGDAIIGIAPYTTDGDLALDPSLLGDEPELEVAMRNAGFQLWEPEAGTAEPGIWVVTATVDDQEFPIAVDLIVPEGASTGAGRRGARLGPHGGRAARRVTGLEVALVDHSTMTIASLEADDARSFEVEVASAVALLVAKAHKLRDRIDHARPGRLDDKDAADVYRLMQTTSPAVVGRRLAALRSHPVAGSAVDAAVSYLADLFTRRGDGTQMAVRALRVALPEAQVVAVVTSYVERLVTAFSDP